MPLAAVLGTAGRAHNARQPSVEPAALGEGAELVLDLAGQAVTVGARDGEVAEEAVQLAGDQGYFTSFEMSLNSGVPDL